MQLVASVLLLVIGVSLAQETVFPSEEPEIVRCRRLDICSTNCEFGTLDDERGCPTCNCRPNPEQDLLLSCPALAPDAVGICVQRCSSDMECSGLQLCCSNGCGHVCMEPVRSQVTPCLTQKAAVESRGRMVGAFMPTCTEDGGFHPQQCHGSTGYCWCVDKEGQEILETRSRGAQLECSHPSPAPPATPCQQKLSAVEQMPGAFTPRCGEDGGFHPEQCHSSSGYCWCVDSDGEMIENTKVHGRQECTQAPQGEAAIEQADQAPEEEVLLATDTPPAPHCNQPKVVGFCRAAMPRFFYNAESGECEGFIYGGCGANENNFDTEEECQEMSFACFIKRGAAHIEECPMDCGCTWAEDGSIAEQDCSDLSWLGPAQPPLPEDRNATEQPEILMSDDFMQYLSEHFDEDKIELMEEAMRAGDAQYLEDMSLPDGVQVPDFGAHANCEDIEQFKKYIDEEDIGDFLSALFPAGLPSCGPEPESSESDLPRMACPLYKCLMSCQFGFKKGDDGCAMCECVTSPCETHECSSGQVCRVESQECRDNMAFGSTCHKAHCVLEPLCPQQKRVTEQGRLLGQGGHGRQQMMGADEWSRGPQGRDQDRMAPPNLQGDGMSGPGSFHFQHFMRDAHVPSCTEEGDFDPTQCNHVTGECWCVDDRGVEVFETRRNVRADQRALDCPHNRTTSLHGNFSINHDIDNIHSHIDNIRELAHQALSEWLVVEREYITIIQISPRVNEIRILEVMFVVRTDENAPHDLAASSLHLQMACHQHQLQLHYQGHVMQPNEASLHINHHFTSVQPPMVYREANHHFFHHHRAALIACFLGVLFLLAIIAVLAKMMLMKRKSGVAHIERQMSNTEEDLQPKMRYKKNLAFNAVFAVGQEDQKNVLSDAEDMAKDEPIV